ncbi:MAG: prepilin peptidase [Alphaproteobacteria bacterium]|nr:prepilin peptidase [Alphaproteobacteria bacterium]MBF0250024.1 prepilin peptidase [Alphaproteobacteria bacterium]
MALMQTVLMALYLGLVLYGAWSDARALRIPNWISLTILAAFFPMAAVSGLPLADVPWHVAAGLVTLVAGFTLFAFGLLGGGDAKLMAACALWIGWRDLWLFVLAVLLVGGVLSLLVILLRKGLGLWPQWLVAHASGLFTPNKAVPYGIAIAAGALLMAPRMAVFPEGWRMIFAVLAG